DRRELLPIEALDDARAVTATRAHQHERLVGGHAEEPRREARLGAERAEAADDLHERRLQEVATGLVADRVTEQLALDVRRDPSQEQVQGLGVAADGAVEDVTFDGEGHASSLCDARAALRIRGIARFSSKGGCKAFRQVEPGPTTDPQSKAIDVG